MRIPKNDMRFIILNDAKETLASALLMEQQAQKKTFLMTSTPTCDIAALPAINVLSVNCEDFVAWRGHVIKIDNDVMEFEAEELIGPHLRRHLRIPIMMSTYVYPAESHEPRRAVITHDVSCGGISIFAHQTLKVGYSFQIAIPFSKPPILLYAKVIRVISEEQQLYACEFYDLLPQEEALLQEGIFEYDLQFRLRNAH